jgi:hypothetical protein
MKKWLLETISIFIAKRYPGRRMGIASQASYFEYFLMNKKQKSPIARAFCLALE